MTDQPYIVELPVPYGVSVDDLWRIEFDTAGQRHWISNVEEPMAFGVFRRWQDRDPGRLINCLACPQSSNSPCPHDELPEQRGWLFTEIERMRIMPMREAV